MGLREERKQLTRRTVITAVVDLAEGSLDELSVPAVSLDTWRWMTWPSEIWQHDSTSIHRLVSGEVVRLSA